MYYAVHTNVEAKVPWDGLWENFLLHFFIVDFLGLLKIFIMEICKSISCKFTKKILLTDFSLAKVRYVNYIMHMIWKKQTRYCSMELNPLVFR